MLLLTIFLPMIVAVVGYCLFSKKEDKYYLLTLVTNISVFILVLLLCFKGNFTNDLNYIVELGLHIELDGFRKVYCLIISFMWMMTMLLSYDYFKHHHKLSRYYFFNLMTEGATLGVFLAADFYTAFVFFEIMSFTSFPWVIQEETDGAIKAANTYLAVAVIGGLTALMGIFILYNQLGTLYLKDMYTAVLNCSNKGLLFIAGSCILVGFGAKAGMFPLHIWLPKAHPVAPAPASSLLSGILTKSGIWGILAITVNIFRYDVAWGNVIMILGTITMFLGALLALFSIDLKRTLACSSMSQIGFILVAIAMMVFLGDENALAARGAILHMMNHSLFKLVLFMAAGVVYMNTHSLDLNKIRGFGKNKPFLMICFLLAAAGIAGIPGLNGYVSKTLIHEAIVEGVGEYAWLKIIEWIFLISGGLTLAYMTKLFVCIFVEDNKEYKEEKKYMSLSSYIALGGSAVLLPLFGLTAQKSMMSIAQMAMSFFNGGELEHNLHFYSLENLKGGIISIVIGILIYVFIVRKFMMKNNKYVNLWPEKLDLEDLVYRPLLLKVLPAMFGGIILRFISDSLDLLLLLLRKTIYKESPLPSDVDEENTFRYKFGSLLDRIFPRRKDKHYYARNIYRVSESVAYSTQKISDTLSFALLAMIAALVFVLLYVLVLHQ